MKRTTMLAAAVAAMTAISCATAQTPNYTFTMPLTEDENDLKAYLVDSDTGDKLDSTVVADGVAKFNGTISKPTMAQLVVDGSRYLTFVLEPGNIVGDATTRSVTGTPTNQKMVDYGRNLGEIVQRYRAVANDTTETGKAEAKKIQSEYYAYMNSTIDSNASNPLGYYLFLQKAYDMSLADLQKALQKYPAFASSKRIQRLQTSLTRKDETSVGRMFKDFSITQPDGTVKKLSDHVGKGHYTLVDFWASWCGPCIRETKVLKKIYEKYNGKGLEILGVAVWDEPHNTLEAIKKHELPWTNIINAQTIPTDIYGISGIPCIILFDPDGKIVSRDKQDDALVADVDAAMANVVAE